MMDIEPTSYNAQTNYMITAPDTTVTFSSIFQGLKLYFSKTPAPYIHSKVVSHLRHYLYT